MLRQILLLFLSKNKMVIRRILFILTCLLTAHLSFGQMKIDESKLPVRMLRGFGISGNMGWNSLTGIGVSIQSYATEHIGFDAGVGISSEGYKFSGRFRYLFLEKNFTPLVAAGFMYGTGIPNYEFSMDYNGNEVVFTIGPSPFLQLTGGIDYVAPGGFFLMANLGYAILLKDNIDYTYGVPTPDTEQIIRIAYQSGVAIEVSIGYIFAKKKQPKNK
jgi:hypothetical protein